MDGTQNAAGTDFADLPSIAFSSGGGGSWTWASGSDPMLTLQVQCFDNVPTFNVSAALVCGSTTHIYGGFVTGITCVAGKLTGSFSLNWSFSIPGGGFPADPCGSTTVPFSISFTLI